MRFYRRLRIYFPELPDLPDPATLEEKGKHDYDWTPPGDVYDYLNPIEERNVWHRIDPERWRGYLIRLYKKARYEQKRALRRKEDERLAALRGPPTNCRLDGNRVLWDPPDIEGGEAPGCYWVQVRRNGEWTTIQPPVYPGQPRQLFLAYRGIEVARVAAYYDDEPQSLGWGYRYGPELAVGAPEKPEPEVDPGPAPTRMDLIVEACRIYSGPRTKRTGAPYIRHLRKRTSFDPEITTKERNEAHRIASE